MKMLTTMVTAGPLAFVCMATPANAHDFGESKTLDQELQDALEIASRITQCSLQPLDSANRCVPWEFAGPPVDCKAADGNVTFCNQWSERK
jgi:hypothetical protein